MAEIITEWGEWAPSVYGVVVVVLIALVVGRRIRPSLADRFVEYVGNVDLTPAETVIAGRGAAPNDPSKPATREERWRSKGAGAGQGGGS